MSGFSIVGGMALGTLGLHLVKSIRRRAALQDAADRRAKRPNARDFDRLAQNLSCESEFTRMMDEVTDLSKMPNGDRDARFDKQTLRLGSRFVVPLEAALDPEEVAEMARQDELDHQMRKRDVERALKANGHGKRGSKWSH